LSSANLLNHETEHDIGRKIIIGEGKTLQTAMSTVGHGKHARIVVRLDIRLLENTMRPAKEKSYI